MHEWWKRPDPRMMEMRGWQEDGPLEGARRGSIRTENRPDSKLSVRTVGMAETAKSDRVFIVILNTECAESNPPTGNPATLGLRP